MKKYNTESFISAAKLVHGNKYNYSKVNYITNYSKVCIICPKHGEFWQTPYSHLKGRGCTKCGHSLDTEEFVNKSKDVHANKYDYSKVKYINNSTKVCIICPEHGEFWQTPKNHLSGKGCGKCANVIKGKSFHKIDKEKITEIKKQAFIKAAKKKFGDLFDYSNINYVNNKTKITINSKKYGEISITPKDHLKLKYGCREEGRKTRKFTNEQFIEKSKLVHGNKYDYSKSMYNGMNWKVCIICPKHGEFWQTPNAHIHLREGCPICNESHLERDINDFLKSNSIAFKRQCANDTFKWIKLQRLDFYLPDYNIAIECQGEQHYNEKAFYPHKNKFDFKKQIKLDLVKKKNCEKNGLKIIYYVDNKNKVLKENICEIYNEKNTFDKLEKLWELLE